MSRSFRTTGPLLDIGVYLLTAHAQGMEVHGWAIMKATKRPGPTVYGVLDRLEDRNWIAGYWEDQNPRSSTPRRRLYRLTDEGRTALLDLVRERRPQALENLHRPAPGSLPPRGSLAPGGAG